MTSLMTSLMTPLRAALPAARRLSAGHSAPYIQGQSPEPRTREYFYYLDHQGQLFLDDTKMKNFVTCFKEKKFLVFFFSKLRANRSGRYEHTFPFLSPCGRERNFLRCDDRPVVFTHLLPRTGGGPELLSYCGGGEELAAEFRPQALFMEPTSGRLYHPCCQRSGGVGLLRSALAIQLSAHFIHKPEDTVQSGQPTHITWGGVTHTLTNELARSFPSVEIGLGNKPESC